MIRVATKEDLPFIYSTWLRSFRYSSDFAKDIESDIYYELHHQLIERIIARGANVFICADDSDINVIHGYLIGEGPVIHFAYVKKPFRGLGIFTDLLKMYPEPIKFITHLTKDAKKFLKDNQNIKYNPYYV